MKKALFWIVICGMLSALLFVGALACDDDDDDDDDNDDDTGEECQAPEEFCELCGSLAPADTFNETSITYDNGDRLAHQRYLLEGDIEAVHFIPEGPFFFRKLKLRFAGDGGKVIIHIYADYGRSWPDEERDLIEPIRLELGDDEGWITIDLTDHQLLFQPGEHFWVGYEHVKDQPYLSFDTGAETEDGVLSYPSHSRLKSQAAIDRWRREGLAFVWAGLSNSYMVRAEGAYFCEWDEYRMKEVTQAAGLKGLTHMRTGWTDINGDGWDDIVLTRAGYTEDMTTILENKGDGTFKDITDETGLGGHYQALNLFGDLDNDGDQDAYLGVYVPQDETDTGARSKIMLNDGDGVFTEKVGSNVDLEATTSGAAFGDYDQDGDLDLYVGNWLVQYPQPASFSDWLFAGQGDGAFNEVTAAAGMTHDGQPCYGVVWGDYDNDNDLDIFVSNYGRSSNFLWQNQGNGRFLDVAKAAGVNQIGVYPGGNTFGADFGDFENDGDLDLYLTEIAHPRYQPTSDIASLLRNLGEEEGYIFEDVREKVGITYDEGEIEVTWVDFDNDGDLDLSLSDLYPLHFARLYRQNENFTFTDVTYMAGVYVHDATNHAWADYDKDGDMDLLITRRSEGGVVHLYQNQMGAENHWLMVKLIGDDSNRDGVGARVKVITGDRTQMREVKGGKGHFNSQPSLTQHFGLGEYDAIDGLEVRWPSGQVDQYLDIAADQYITITEGADDIVEQ